MSEKSSRKTVGDFKNCEMPIQKQNATNGAHSANIFQDFKEKSKENRIEVHNRIGGNMCCGNGNGVW